MEPLGVRLARALMGAQAGGFLATPPGLDGASGLGVAGLSGAPRPSDFALHALRIDDTLWVVDVKPL